MSRSNRRDTGRPPGASTRADTFSGAHDIVMALGSAERKAQTLADTPSEFAPPGDNPYRVSTVAPPVGGPRAKMARGLGRRPLI